MGIEDDHAFDVREKRRGGGSGDGRESKGREERIQGRGLTGRAKKRINTFVVRKGIERMGR